MNSPRRPVIFPNGYVWFVFVSALDIMLTWVVFHVGGYEANHLAAQIIYRFGLPGLVVYKFALVIVVILICETIGDRHKEAARKLLSVGIMFTCMPVILAVFLILLNGP
jgi:Domain of unknown function (DUF5658)